MATVIERDDAIALVKQRVAWDQTPQLTEDQIEGLVDAAARPDPSGNPVEDLDAEDRVWLPTYDLNSACARAFELKAAEVANRFDIDIDRQGLSRSQLQEHFLQLAAQWRARQGGTVRAS